MANTKKLIFAAMCVALGVVLPIAFHSVPQGGMVFLPMHIPVLLCGMICGWPYGLACGVLTPVISFAATGMPNAANLPGMLFELAVYGLTSGLLMKFVRTGRMAADIYISLACAMLLGRLTAGLLNGLIFRAGQYSLEMWTGVSFVTALPGIAIQLVLLPLVVIALERAKVVPKRYPQNAVQTQTK